MHKFWFLSSARRMMRVIDLGLSHFRKCKTQKDYLAAYRDWKEEVSKNVPSEKLLVFNVKEGWTPLCKFLGKEVPKVPFPHVNDSIQVHSWIRNARIALWTLYALGAIIVVLLAVVVKVQF